MLFARGTLIGVDCALRCAVVDLSAAGAMLTVAARLQPPARLPTPPLRLEFELAGERLELPVEIRRMSRGGGVAVAFPHPHSERLYRLIAIEQRRALGQRRVNISERRIPPSFGDARSQASQPPEDSES
jgi:hypothetical protein